MNSITYIGMDVHTTNYRLCAYTLEGQKTFAETTVNLNIKELIKYLERLKARQNGKEESGSFWTHSSYLRRNYVGTLSPNGDPHF